MATFTVKIDTANDAFQPDPNSELARILRSIAEKIEQNGNSGFFETIFDANGNDVGRFALKSADYR